MVLAIALMAVGSMLPGGLAIGAAGAASTSSRGAAAHGSAARAASTVPNGFSDTVAISGLTMPTDVAFAPDGRVFVGEKSGLIKVFDVAVGHHADRLRGPAHPGAQLPGSRPPRPHARPRVPDPAVRVRPLHPRRGARRHRAAVGRAGRHQRRLPRPARRHHRRLRRAGAPVQAHRHRQPDERRRAGARRGLVPAVPQPHHRHRPVRPRRGSLRERRRRCQLQLRRLRPDQEPVR